jgi:Holliday junction resolvasome RuvABC ATP-dependent DNA helicase subunit
MAKRITPKLIQASDDLGIVLAEIAQLQEQKGDLQKVLIDSGFDEIDGELFRTTVSHSVRKQVAWKRIAEKLGVSNQQIAANTKKIPIDTVRVVARKAS